MQIKAEQKNSRQSPRKVRLLANQVKDLPLDQAFEQLSLMERKGAIVLLKVLRQAVANATHNYHLKFEDLEIEHILVKTGPTYKRMRPVSRGRAHRILKRTCHVEVVLKTKQNVSPRARAQQAEAKTDQDKADDEQKNKKQSKQKIKKSPAQGHKEKSKPEPALKDTSKVKQQIKKDPTTAKRHRRQSTSARQ